MSKLNIVNVGYDSTNYYVLVTDRTKLLIDVGMPGTLPKLEHQCKRMDISLSDIQYLLCTHYHPDHAGISQQVKMQGAKLIVCDGQNPDVLTGWHPDQIKIEPAGNIPLSISNSREFLAGLGLRGEIISTPAHSDDSVTLILDDGIAFTGDLTHPSIAMTDSSSVDYACWREIQSHNVRTVYPGHGPIQVLNLPPDK